MRSIYMIRHAKSSWSDFTQKDFDRPLNERGKSDAPMMAERLIKRGIVPDAFLSSTAQRAKETCLFFCAAYNIPEKDILLTNDLYHASAPQIYKVISELDDQYKKVAVFCHNPGISEFANSLTASVQIDEMPTCGIFAVSAECKHWKDFQQAEKQFLFFDYPKLKSTT